MSQVVDVLPSDVPAWRFRSIGRFLYTQNPFYLLSCFLIIDGLPMATVSQGDLDVVWLRAIPAVTNGVRPTGLGGRIGCASLVAGLDDRKFVDGKFVIWDTTGRLESANLPVLLGFPLVRRIPGEPF